ncbi:MAG: Rieske (2Fe-2S) protein [Gaiella sp.]
MTELEICPLSELPPGAMKVVSVERFLAVGVYNCNGELYALEDRCSHDDGPLCEGEWDLESCQVTCPRHGARFDIKTGAALLLPAYLPVETYPVTVREDGMVVVTLP